MTLWLTGLPSSGKTTIAKQLASVLVTQGRTVEVLDGDELRRDISRGLGFSLEDRWEHIRRVGFLAEVLQKRGAIVIVAAIAPYRELREEMRRRLRTYVEVFVNAPLSICEQRDVKGLYRRARTGELKCLTGVDDVYEAPVTPEVECHTHTETVDQSVARILEFLNQSLTPESNRGVGRVAGDVAPRYRSRCIITFLRTPCLE